MLSMVISTMLRRISLPFGAHGVQVVARALVDPVHEGFGLGFGIA